MLKPFDPMTCFTIILAGFIVACICHQSHKHHHKFRFWIEYVKFRFRVKRLEHAGAIECPRHPHRASDSPISLDESKDYIRKFLHHTLGENQCAASELAKAIYRETKTVSGKGRCPAACSSDLVSENTRRRVGTATRLHETVLSGLRRPAPRIVGDDDGEGQHTIDGSMSVPIRAIVDHNHSSSATAAR